MCTIVIAHNNIFRCAGHGIVAVIRINKVINHRLFDIPGRVINPHTQSMSNTVFYRIYSQL